MSEEIEEKKENDEVEKELLTLSGVTSIKKAYFFHSALFCTLVVVVLCFFNFVSPVPFALVLASLFFELWWRNRITLTMATHGLEYGKECIPWKSIVRYSGWGPVGVAFTPFQLQGVIMYLDDGKSMVVTSRSPAFQLLVQRLARLKLDTPAEPLWHNYPTRALRLLRYMAAIGFGVIFLLLVFFEVIVIILLCAGAGYWMFRLWKKARNQHRKMSKKYFWVFLVAMLVLLALTFYIFKGVLTNFFVATIPVLLILWFPWKIGPFILYKETLFVGPKRAYSLQHLKTTQEESKFLLFKVWRLSFANGSVEIMPLLENYEEFKKECEKTWKEVQQREPQEQKQVIRTPRQEAKYLQESFQIPSIY